MKECTKEQLDMMLNKSWIRLGTFQFNNRTIDFAMNIVKEDVYLFEGINEIRFGYALYKGGILKTFVYDGLTYTHSRVMIEKKITPIRKRLTTTLAVFGVVDQNENVRFIRQAEAALALLAFSAIEDLVGEDLMDTEHGSHILPESLIVEPDFDLHLDKTSDSSEFADEKFNGAMARNFTHKIH